MTGNECKHRSAEFLPSRLRGRALTEGICLVKFLMMLFSKGSPDTSARILKRFRIRALVSAAKSGNLEVVKHLITQGTDPNAIEIDERMGIPTGLEPLNWAAWGGHADTVRYLIINGAHLNGEGVSHWIPLQWAVRDCDFAMCKFILDYGGEVNIRDSEGISPLQEAARTGCLDIARMFVTRGANVNAVPEKEPTCNCVECTKSPLHMAATCGHIEMARFLMESGADLNARDSSGDTPLYHPVREGHSAMVELLVANGADVNIRNDSGLAPLHVSANGVNIDTLGYVHFGRKRTTEFLLRNGANVNTKDGKARTPLHIAVSTFNIFINTQGDDDPAGTGANQYCLDSGRVAWLDMVKLLVLNGADLTTEDNEGQTPLQALRASLRGIEASLAARHQPNRAVKYFAVLKNIEEFLQTQTGLSA